MIVPIAPMAPIARNSVQAIRVIHCFHLIAPIASCEVKCTGQVVDPGVIFFRQVESKMAARNRRARIVAFLSFAVDDIAAQKNKGSPKCT